MPTKAAINHLKRLYYNFVVEVPTKKFLVLTTTNDKEAEEISQEAKPYTGSFGDLRNPIALFIDVDKSKIIHHDGRHRVSGFEEYLIKQGLPLKVEVAVKLFNKEHPGKGSTYNKVKGDKEIRFIDLPSTIKGEHRGFIRKEEMKLKEVIVLEENLDNLIDFYLFEGKNSNFN